MNIKFRRSLTLSQLAIKWLLCATVLLALPDLFHDIQVEGFATALTVALVLGIFNTLLRPLLIILTLPITVLSLGLFLFVINALLFWAAANILKGFEVASFGAAMVGSLFYSAMNLLIDSALGLLNSRQSHHLS